MIMAVENNVHAMVLQQFGNRAHLVVDEGCVARSEGWLMVDDDFPRLLAGIEVLHDPLARRSRIGPEGRRRSIESIAAGQIVVEQVRVGIEEEDVGIAVIEGIVALVIDLDRGAFAGVDLSRIAKGSYGRGGVEGLSLVGEGEAGGHGGVYVPVVLDIESLRPILREIEVVEERESISTAEIAAEERRGVVGQKIGGYAGAAQVMVAVGGKKKLAPGNGGSGLVGVLIAVVDRKEEVAVAILRAFVVDIVAGVEDEVGWRQRRHARDSEVRGIMNQMSDARFVVHDDRGIGVGYGWEEAFVSYDYEGEDVAQLARMEGRGKPTRRHARTRDAVLILRVVTEAAQDGSVVRVRSISAGDGR